jgi:hypothetical protein
MGVACRWTWRDRWIQLLTGRIKPHRRIFLKKSIAPESEHRYNTIGRKVLPIISTVFRINQMKKIDALPIYMSQDSDYQVHLTREKNSGELEKMGLFQVIMTMKQTRNGTALHPIVSMYYVLAESEEEAISQVDDCAAGGGTCSGYEALQNGDLAGTATRIPLHIRGWGRQTF